MKAQAITAQDLALMSGRTSSGLNFVRTLPPKKARR
jgi:hypothetical protein